MGVPIVYRAGGESAITSYDFNQFADGTGVAVFYGSKISGAYILTKNAVYSDSVITKVHPPNSGAWYLTIDADFDTVINKPTLVRGKMYANVNFSTSTASNNSAIIVRLRKVSGGVETEVAASNMNINDGSAPKLGLVFLDVPLAKYKKGDTMRVTVELWCNFSTSEYGAIFHDPKGRTPSAGELGTVTAPTNSFIEFGIPIVIDL